MITALKAAGLPTPDPLVGDMVEALARAGAFRLQFRQRAHGRADPPPRR